MKKKPEFTTVDLINTVAAMAEALAGLRNSLIAQGFSEAAAEQIVIQSVSRQPR
jgi:hypothetical protein